MLLAHQRFQHDLLVVFFSVTLHEQKVPLIPSIYLYNRYLYNWLFRFGSLRQTHVALRREGGMVSKHG